MTSLTGEVNKFYSDYEEEGFISKGGGGGAGCTLPLDPLLLPILKREAGFSSFSSLNSLFEKLRFLDRSVWTVAIKLHIQISPAGRGQGRKV